MALWTAVSAGRLPWMSDSAAIRTISAVRSRGAMMKLEEGFTRHVAVDRGDALAAPELAAEALHRHFEAKLVPGVTMRLKRHSSMAANRPRRSPKPGCCAT